MAKWSKAEVCKTFIRGFKSRLRLQPLFYKDLLQRKNLCLTHAYMNLRLLTFFLLLVLPLSAFQQEEILNYDVDVLVEEDGTLDITESIKVRAMNNKINRGIYRDFPHIVKDKWGITSELPFKVIKVTKNGVSESYGLKKQPGGTRIKIGNSNIILKPGIYTYVIQYRTNGWMLSQKNADELYWNVTGNHWVFPILNSTCTIKFPAGAECINAGAYTGKKGEKEQNYRVQKNGSSVEFILTKPLRAREGLTISAQIPKGYLTLSEQKLPKMLLFILGAFVATISWFLGAWLYVGRDPRKGIIFPEFTAPEGMSAGAVRFVKKMNYDNDCFTAGVVELAQKGALMIEHAGNKYSLSKKEREASASLTGEEDVLNSELFSSQDKLLLDQKNHRTIAGARAAHHTEIKEKYVDKLFHKNVKWLLPGLALSIATLGLSLIFFKNVEGIFLTVWLTIWTFGCFALVSTWVKALLKKQFAKALPIFLFSIPFLGFWCFGAFMLLKASSPLLLVLIITITGINALFSKLMKAPTREGRKILDHIEGLKHYLSVAEKDRLNMAEAPAQTPKHFEEFLPYAMALGVGENWTSSFADTLEKAAMAEHQSSYRPSFYTGHFSGSHTFLSSAALGGALGSALSSAATSPSSSGGSGGGGSSGGGGGGGGW